MNKKVKNPTEVLNYYNHLHSELKKQNLHLYVAKGYYYHKIATKFNITVGSAYNILTNEWRKLRNL